MTNTSRGFGLVSLLLAIALCALLAACSSSTDDPPAVTVQTTEAPPVATATEEPTQAPTATPTAEPTQVASQQEAKPPQSGRWIDVDVTNFTVRLMNGTSATKVIGPVGVGEQIDTGVYESTQTGLFYVYNMDASLTYDAPYDTYISHWVGFDPNLANGFHSFLKDANGKVVDASTGRISNGCIRTGDPEAIYAFAEIGMPVYVHF